MSKKLKKVEVEAANLMEEAVGNEEVLTFDVYFQILLKAKQVMAHHKPPMRQYAEAKGRVTATKAEFDELFKSY